MAKKIKELSICGYENVKKEIQQLITLYNDPAKAKKLGVPLPKGILLTGDPGNGKTKFARYFMAECHRPCFLYTEKTTLHDLFEKARKGAPSIVFIDEFDKVVGHSDEQNAAMLSELDGAVVNNDVLVLACASSLYAVDDALLRPGRFDRIIRLGSPSTKTRKAIAKKMISPSLLGPDVTYDLLATLSSGSSCAGVSSICQTMRLVAYENQHEKITRTDAEVAVGRVNNTDEGYEVEMDPLMDIDRVATHEAGHLLAGLAYLSRELVYKASIVTTSQLAGYVRILKDSRKTNRSSRDILDEVVVDLSGLAAQEALYGVPMSGASSDLVQARHTLKDAINNEGLFGVGLAFNRAYYEGGEGIRNRIDQVISQELDAAYQEAVLFMKNNVPSVELLRDRLLKKKVLYGEDWSDIHPNLLVKESSANHEIVSLAHTR